MPRKFIKRPRIYRRKKRTIRRKVSRVPRPILSGFTKSKMVKLRYVETGVSMDPSVGSNDQYIFRANSCFDPNYTGVGHQPMGFDQWAGIYTKYTVVGSKCTMRFSPTISSNVVPGRFGVLLSTDLTGIAHFSTINNLLESRLIGNTRIGGAYTYNTSKQPTAVKGFSAKKFFGKVNVVDGAENSALVTANPDNTAYFCCWTSAMNSTQDPGILNFDIQIDYIVKFTDPVVIDGS